MANNAVWINTGATTVTVSDGLTGDGSGGNPLVVDIDGTTLIATAGVLSASGTVTTVTATTVNATNVVASGDVKGATFHVGATAGIDTSITTAALVGKTITVTKGLITGFA